MQLGSVCGSDGGGGSPFPTTCLCLQHREEWGVIPAVLVFVMGHHIPWIPASSLALARAPSLPGLRNAQPYSNMGCRSWVASRSEQRDAFRTGRWKKPHRDHSSWGIPTSDHHGQGSHRARGRDPRQAGQQRQGTLTLTPSRGPGRRQRRAGTWIHTYIKNNNNKNLLALRTAQPAQGDELAWHFQTSCICPNNSESGAPSHVRDAACSGAEQHTPQSSPFRNTTVTPHKSYHLSTEIGFATLFLKEGLLPLLNLHTPRSRWSLGQKGPPFLAGKSRLHLSLGERLGGSWKLNGESCWAGGRSWGLLGLTLQNQNRFQTLTEAGGKPGTGGKSCLPGQGGK